MNLKKLTLLGAQLTEELTGSCVSSASTKANVTLSMREAQPLVKGSAKITFTAQPNAATFNGEVVSSGYEDPTYWVGGDVLFIGEAQYIFIPNGVAKWAYTSGSTRRWIQVNIGTTLEETINNLIAAMSNPNELFNTNSFFSSVTSNYPSENSISVVNHNNYGSGYGVNLNVRSTSDGVSTPVFAYVTSAIINGVPTQIPGPSGNIVITGVSTKPNNYNPNLTYVSGGRQAAVSEIASIDGRFSFNFIGGSPKGYANTRLYDKDNNLVGDIAHPLVNGVDFIGMQIRKASDVSSISASGNVISGTMAPDIFSTGRIEVDLYGKFSTIDRKSVV